MADSCRWTCFSDLPCLPLSFFPPLYFLIQILLIKLWEPAGLLPPPLPSSSPQLSHREHKELESGLRETARETREEWERLNRGWIHGGSALLLISILALWMKLFRGAPRPSIPNTPPKLSLNPHRVCTHTCTHMQTCTAHAPIYGNESKHQWMH